MAVTQVGTPTATAYTTVNGANTVTNTWAASQPRTANDILVMVCSAAAVTSVTLPTAPVGWSTAANVGSASGGGAGPAWVGIFYLTAVGADAAPSFTLTTSGTTRTACTLVELTGGNPSSPLDASGTFSNNGPGVVDHITVSTSSSVAGGGEYAITSFARENSSSTTPTWTAGSGWTNFSSDASTSSRDHNFADQLANPAAGAVLTETATITSATSSFAAAGIAVFALGYNPPVPSLNLSQAVKMAATF